VSHCPCLDNPLTTWHVNECAIPINWQARAEVAEARAAEFGDQVKWWADEWFKLSTAGLWREWCLEWAGIGWAHAYAFEWNRYAPDALDRRTDKVRTEERERAARMIEEFGIGPMLRDLARRIREGE
jgi:hypothetical protein